MSDRLVERALEIARKAEERADAAESRAKASAAAYVLANEAEEARGTGGCQRKDCNGFVCRNAMEAYSRLIT